MKIKTIQSQLVYFKTFETTLKDINQLVGDKPAEIIEEIQMAGLELNGPQIWEYKGADGLPDTKFTLNICVPIKEGNKVHEDSIKTLEEFKCGTDIMNGSWNNFKNAYCKLIGEIMGQKHQLSTTCREIYINCDFENPENNITEIQMEII